MNHAMEPAIGRLRGRSPGRGPMAPLVGEAPVMAVLGALSRLLIGPGRWSAAIRIDRWGGWRWGPLRGGSAIGGQWARGLGWLAR